MGNRSEIQSEFPKRMIVKFPIIINTCYIYIYTMSIIYVIIYIFPFHSWSYTPMIPNLLLVTYPQFVKLWNFKTISRAVLQSRCVTPNLRQFENFKAANLRIWHSQKREAHERKKNWADCRRAITDLDWWCFDIIISIYIYTVYFKIITRWLCLTRGEQISTAAFNTRLPSARQMMLMAIAMCYRRRMPKLLDEILCLFVFPHSFVRYLPTLFNTFSYFFCQNLGSSKNPIFLYVFSSTLTWFGGKPIIICRCSCLGFVISQQAISGKKHGGYLKCTISHL